MARLSLRILVLTHGVHIVSLHNELLNSCVLVIYVNASFIVISFLFSAIVLVFRFTFMTSMFLNMC